MQNKQVKVIQPRVSFDSLMDGPKSLKKRVCAYVRVSTDNEDQKTSYIAQTDEYTNRITTNPDWTFCGIYADEGISGTSTKHRRQFNSMMESARRGEIDLIITKSISRFARNTVDCLNYIREMRSRNVEIFFEKENIYSSDPKVDFLLTIMSSIAQEEAMNVSENVKWNVQKRFNNGVPIVNHKRFLGYTKDRKGGNLVVVPEEAKIVRKVFQMYINGVGPQKIAAHMVSQGVSTGAGAKRWSASTVHSILKNEKYTGDLVQQKTITVDYLSHKKVANKDIAPKYHIENNHEAIVDKETFLLAQRICEDRRKTKIGKDKNLAKYNVTYPFSAFIICSECGRTLKRRYWNYGSPAERVMQQCGGYIDGKANCKAKATYQELIEGATVQMLNEVFLNNRDIIPIIQSVIKSTIRVTDVEVKIAELRKENDDIEQMMSNLIDMQVKMPSLSDETFNQKYNAFTKQLKTNLSEIQKLEAEYIANYDTRSRLSKIESTLNRLNEPITEVDSDTLRSFVYRMISVKPDEIIYCVAGKKNYSDQEFSEKRHEFVKVSPIAEGVFHCQKYAKDMHYRVVVI
ncbi:MAG: recombinase family protein [Candidatus Izemoplasmatales bacterium]|jgi:DNA invertase Pin-like site-specific DNA recombinase|nr:recombinase family protein [Candidatus Izemoplasmatales bacterium]MDY0373578.1 recombinase family protein [Candidatus Izemoplasmatales bacterium]